MSSEMMELRRAYDARIASAEEQAIALQSQVSQLSAELNASVTQRSTIESEWSSKHDLVEKERKRLVSELESAQASAAAAQSSLSNEHDMVVSDLRGKLDALREELCEQESAGMAARDTINDCVGWSKIRDDR